MEFRRILIFWMSLLIISSTVSAAEIEDWNVPGDFDFIQIKGEISRGDAERFENVIAGKERITVVLESPGGLVAEALRIGANIRTRNFATMVVDGGKCYSACGLIWVSGARRYMAADSRIGFHAAYRKEAGEYRESGVANAEIGSFLTHLGLRIEAIRFFTTAGPDKFLMLTPQRARALGIEVYELEGLGVIGPNDAPTADLHATRFVSLVLMKGRCSGFFQPDIGVIEQGLKSAFAEGNRLVASEKWIELWIPMLDEAKEALAASGPVKVCIENEAFLRAGGLRTGISGPSFSCGQASTVTEHAICNDADLWAKDRAMSAIYFHIRKYYNANVGRRILADQREWLRNRNTCKGDIVCLNRIYDERLHFFKDVDVEAS